MAFVLDASLTASWGLADESSAFTESVLLRLWDETSLVPQIWWYEIRNLLVVNERRQHISPEETARFLRNLAEYPIIVDDARDEGTVLHLARQYKLSFYDASYLALAMRERLPLATLDKALRAAAISAGIPLLA